jgi:hypothetical protein
MASVGTINNLGLQLEWLQNNLQSAQLIGFENTTSVAATSTVTPHRLANKNLQIYNLILHPMYNVSITTL